MALLFSLQGKSKMKIYTRDEIIAAELERTDYNKPSYLGKSLAATISPSASLERAIFGASSAEIEVAERQMAECNAAMADPRVKEHHAKLRATHRAARLAQLAELYP